MTKILRNHIIHEFAGVCYENPDLYHERHDKRSRYLPQFSPSTVLAAHHSPMSYRGRRRERGPAFGNGPYFHNQILTHISH